MIPLKIITQEEAFKNGWTNAPTKGNIGSSSPAIAIAVVGTTIQDPDKPKGVMMNKVLEVHEIDLQTNEKKIVFEHADYKKEKKRLKINEYKEKPKSDS